MAIIEKYDESLFISRFEDYKRVETIENKGGNFTYKGLRALFQYLDNLSEDIELDVIGLCCDYAEYPNLKEYLEEFYGTGHNKQDENESDEEFYKRIEDEINDKTTLIKLGDDLDEGFIIQGN